MNKFKKLNKFSASLLFLLLFLAILLIVTFRGIFSAISTSKEVDQEFLDTQAPRIDKENLDKAYDWVTNKKVTTLDLRE
jgi:uncharacterized protein (UPF0333 family)